MNIYLPSTHYSYSLSSFLEDINRQEWWIPQEVFWSLEMRVQLFRNNVSEINVRDKEERKRKRETQRCGEGVVKDLYVCINVSLLKSFEVTPY